MDLEQLARTSEVFEFDLGEDTLFSLESLGAEQVTSFEMFLGGNGKGVLNDSQKIDYCKNNIKGWRGLKSSGEELEFNDSNKMLFAQKKYATVLMAMITASYTRWREIEDQIEKDSESAKK